MKKNPTKTDLLLQEVENFNRETRKSFNSINKYLKSLVIKINEVRKRETGVGFNAGRKKENPHWMKRNKEKIGQKKPVFIYYPLSFHPSDKDSSFDVILNNILENKRKIREEALMPAEPSKQEKHEFYRTITGEEWLSDNKSSFYHSEAWQELRKQVFQKYPSICGRCGNKNHLEVDHVKPRSKYLDLELELGNLQILCRDCNLLKGTQDSPEWDFRKTS